jgi:hypothetical protein
MASLRPPPVLSLITPVANRVSLIKLSYLNFAKILAFLIICVKTLDDADFKMQGVTISVIAPINIYFLEHCFTFAGTYNTCHPFEEEAYE